MKRKFQKALEDGTNIKTLIFATDKGVYTINLREWNGDIYFFKYRDGEIVECLNLSKQAKYLNGVSGDRNLKGKNL